MIDVFWAGLCLAGMAGTLLVLFLDRILYVQERSHAKAQGRRAALRGGAEWDCPYREDGLRLAWLHGFAGGRDERGAAEWN